MTRLFLALSLVVQLSGFVAAGAVVCQASQAQQQSCCCHHPADTQAPTRGPVAFPSCPCAMAPGIPAPVTTTPATEASSRDASSAYLAAVPALVAPQQAAAYAPLLPNVGDSTPPYLTAAHPRC